MALLKDFALFCLGGSAYTGLELLWRGRSHSTMFVLAGACFLAIGRWGRGRPLPVRLLTGSAICTAGELLCGLAFNRDHRIWDYRSLPLNFRGQICAVYSLLWIPISLAAILLYDRAEALLQRKPAAGNDGLR